MMEFTFDGFVRCGFGFYNPNHAAAAICAVLPFLWGWRRYAAIGWILSIALLVPLSLTYSRTGFVVAAIEVVAWMVISGKRKAALPFLLSIAAVAVIGGTVMRFTPDAAAMNRLSIWWEGVRLAAANPFGVGLENSGQLASSFMLDGIECRTLVNSHLTLLVELGWIVGLAWMGFVLCGIFSGIGRMRIWCAFTGLSLSAFSSSVFDWHVLFGATDGFGSLNLLLSWMLFVSYIGCGFWLVLQRWTLRRLLVALSPVALFALLLSSMPKMDVPVVHDGFVVKKGECMPVVFRDSTWPIRATLHYLDDGYRIKITPGYADVPVDVDSAILFGAVAESAFRFPKAQITVVEPPEFCTLPSNAKLAR